MKCPYCSSKHTTKAGFKISVSKGRRPRRQCMECGHTFYPDAKKGGKV